MEENQAHYHRISEILSQKMMEEKEMNWNVSCLKYEEELIKREVSLKVEMLNKLELCLDKLSFANSTPYKTTSCISAAGELNNQKLQFIMQHGSKNMENEKKLMREIKSKSSQNKEEVGTTLDELDAPIKKLDEQIKSSHLYLYRTDFERIYREKKLHEMEKEKAVANAAVGGRLWSSLGSKNDIQQQVKVMHEELDELRLQHVETRNRAKSGEKKLRRLEKQIVFLQKQLLN